MTKSYKIIGIIYLLAIQTLLTPVTGMANENSRIQQAKGHTKLQVYFVPWNILTRTRLSPDDVKKISGVTMTIRETYFITEIENRLKNLTFRENEKMLSEDVRIVIELFNDDGSVDMYFGNRSHLFLPYFRKMADIDSEFFSVLNVF